MTCCMCAMNQQPLHDTELMCGTMGRGDAELGNLLSSFIWLRKTCICTQLILSSDAGDLLNGK